MNTRQKLNRICRELNGLYHDISAQLGLSDSESMILYILYDAQEPLTQSGIAKATGLSKQTLHSAVRRLEREGAVVLEKLDGKSKRIVVTEKGRVKAAQRVRPIVDMEERILDAWPEQDRQQCLLLLERFREQLEKEIHAYETGQQDPAVGSFHL